MAEDKGVTHFSQRLYTFQTFFYQVRKKTLCDMP